MHVNVAEREGDIRLADSRADPEGQWEYGRLEVIRQGVWTNIRALGTPESASLACQAFGYEGGAPLQLSPGTLGANIPTGRSSIACNDTDVSLSDCPGARPGRFCSEDHTVLACTNTIPGELHSRLIQNAILALCGSGHMNVVPFCLFAVESRSVYHFRM